MESKYNDHGALDYLEIIILFMLPMPFLKLNIIYIVLVLMVTGLSKYLRKERWDQYGFCSVDQRFLGHALVIGLVFGLVDNFFLEPFITKSLVGKVPDLSTLQETKGNLKNAAVLLAVGWVIGGLFEEFLFRGYLFHRISFIFSNERIQKWAAILLTSIVFAFAHAYQDLAGMLSAFYFSVIMGLFYFYFKRNVWYLVLIHGIYDTIGVSMLFMGW